MDQRTARELYDQLGQAQRKLDDILNRPDAVDITANVAYACRKLDTIRNDLWPAMHPPPQSDPDGNLLFTGELRSGDFGPDTGYYRAFVELCGVMTPLVASGRSWWPTRDEARAAATPHNGHVAIVGIPDRQR